MSIIGRNTENMRSIRAIYRFKPKFVCFRSLFTLDADFVKSYEGKPAPFGFNGLGELVYKRTYSRPLPSGDKEKWYQTVERVSYDTFLYFICSGNVGRQWVL